MPRDQRLTKKLAAERPIKTTSARFQADFVLHQAGKRNPTESAETADAANHRLFFRVLAAFFAERERAAAPRRRATFFA